jgi:hypothetical protein
VNEPPEDSHERPASELDPRPEPLLFRIVRSAIAPPVLKDGGHDAPLSGRGRIVFWVVVSLLVAGIAVLLVATATR